MPTYCSLSDAYGSNWGNPDNKKNTDTKNANEKRVQEYNDPRSSMAYSHGQTMNSMSAIKKAQKAPEGNPIEDICPHCNQCLHMNNKFQQKVVDTAIRPLPRWVPQSPNLQPFDPFTRYFPSGSEHFGNVNFGGYQRRDAVGYPSSQRRENFGAKLSTNNAEKLMQLVLYLLIALFILQLFELISKLGDT